MLSQPISIHVNFIIMASEFEIALEQIVEEKGISKDDVIAAIGSAIGAAYRKEYGTKGQFIDGEFDPKTMQTKLFEVREVVATEEELEKPERQILLEEAQKMDASLAVGGELRTPITPPDDMEFGRIAAQTAKQVIAQRLREAEREVVMDVYADREGELLNGTVQRIERGNIFVDLGQAVGILFSNEQIPTEHYRIGDRIKVLLVEVRYERRGPELILSRTHPDVIRRLFEMEVPEVASGAVELKGISREPGSRAKIAVSTQQEDIDPVGSCVGQRGARVQAVIGELSGEKIDVIEWDENPVRFLSNAMSPARVISVKLDEATRHATVEVEEDQLSLAIGRQGQNVRLAVRLTGWSIDVVKEGEEGRVGGAIDDELELDELQEDESAAPEQEEEDASQVEQKEQKERAGKAGQAEKDQADEETHKHEETSTEGAPEKEANKDAEAPKTE